MEQIVELDKVQEACKRSLKFLCTQILGYEDWGDVHDDLEIMLNRPSKRKLIMLPRGHLKSSIITKGYVVKRVLQNPNIRVLIANQVWDKAKEMLYEVKEFFTTKSSIPHIFGEFTSNRWRDDEIVIRQRTKALSAPTIGTTGVESEMTSAHFDLIILDDLQGLQNCQTKEQRDKVKRFYRSMSALLDPGGEMIVLGTRWHYDDFYQDIMDNEKEYYDITVRQVIEDNKIIFPKKFNLKFDSKRKDWVYQEALTLDYIDFLRNSLGPDFYSQYMNQPIDSENQLIKRDYFKYYRRKPEGLFTSITVDPAMSYSQKSDFTAIMACGMDCDRNIYVLDYIRGHWGSPSEIISNILQMCDKWHPLALGIEGNGFQKSLKFWMEELIMKKRKIPPITELKAPVTKTKELRLKGLEPYYRNGMIYHHETMKGRDLENELLMLTTDGYKGKNDDLFDALAWQLELLMQGDKDRVSDAPVGSWAYEVREAHKATLHPYNFFRE